MVAATPITKADHGSKLISWAIALAITKPHIQISNLQISDIFAFYPSGSAVTPLGETPRPYC
ncbi:hypothetical protein COO91_08042 [Nostoc flagelliforme CCNUN1]|uniref:Uncharacterized protein n=1 Tax=Nostoc flagelliforme CCNUN1 TaxID=2038116 RepID=A0A2K8T2P8_9NOSO|nr:hypothetical protein COO91_08042 [Nostoc flagelliforme CCNUN1]